MRTNPTRSAETNPAADTARCTSGTAGDAAPVAGGLYGADRARRCDGRRAEPCVTPRRAARRRTRSRPPGRKSPAGLLLPAFRSLRGSGGSAGPARRCGGTGGIGSAALAGGAGRRRRGGGPRKSARHPPPHSPTTHSTPIHSLSRSASIHPPLVHTRTQSLLATRGGVGWGCVDAESNPPGGAMARPVRAVGGGVGGGAGIGKSCVSPHKGLRRAPARTGPVLLPSESPGAVRRPGGARQRADHQPTADPVRAGGRFRAAPTPCGPAAGSGSPPPTRAACGRAVTRAAAGSPVCWAAEIPCNWAATGLKLDCNLAASMPIAGDEQALGGGAPAPHHNQRRRAKTGGRCTAPAATQR
jgi:hypothetical protein